VLSSKIEGTQSTLEEVLSTDLGSDGPAKQGDMLEVINYMHAQEMGMKCIKSQKIDVELIKNLHKRLMHGVRGEKAQPGSIRSVQNYISKYQTGVGMGYATYVPPPHEMVPDLLNNMTNYMENGTGPELVKIGLMHYQFEAIHPFLDGNGRIGRLLIALYMLQALIELKIQTILYI
jgi:Fic family protein